MAAIPNSAGSRPPWSRLKDRFQELNFFSGIEEKTAHDVRNQHLSTRIFLVLFTSALVVLVLYTSVEPITVTKTVQQPNFSTYKQLNAHYTQTLVCPCKTITIPYDNFISFDPKYHQVCQSDFVSERWIEYLLRSQHSFYLDIRHVGGPAFQLLATLCLLSQQIINNELLVFYSTTFIMDTLVSELTFNQQVLALINTFKDRTKNSFTTTLSSVKDLLQSNALVTILQTNYALVHSKDSDDPATFISYHVYDGLCSCLESSLCVEEASIYQNVDGSMQPIFNISNFHTGCYIIEALLQSSLAYFYNQTSVSELQSYFDLSNNSEKFNITALDLSIPSNYTPTTAISDLLNMLMTEDWNSKTSFESYFNVCQPLSCTYTYSGHNDFIYVVTTAFGLIGGIATALLFLVPLIVGVIRKNENPGVINEGNRDDFRATMSTSFSTLLALCELSNEIVYNNLQYFNSTNYVTSTAVSETLFQAQTNEFVDIFQQTTINSFKNSLELVRELTQGNALAGPGTNYNFRLLNGSAFEFVSIPLYQYELTGELCYCKTNISCAARSMIYTVDHTPLYTIPSFYSGCYIIESLLSSTLECFFDRSCLDAINTYMYNISAYPFNATVLNSSSKSKFAVNSTLRQIVQQLMVEEWNSEVSFDKYYSSCAPGECTYTYQKRTDLIYILTTIAGLLGGLTTIFKLLIPPVVAFFRRTKDTEAGEKESLHAESNFCELAQKTIQNELITFNSTKFISVSVISQRLFQSKTESTIQTFKQTTVSTFIRSLQLVQNITRGNSFMSGLLTNTQLSLIPFVLLPDSYYDYLQYSDRTYNETIEQCDCRIEQFCFQQAAIYKITLPDYDYGWLQYISTAEEIGWQSIPGLYVGCYIADALLHSDLRCFYDQSCLSTLLKATQYPPDNITSLNSSVTSQYTTTTSIDQLVRNLLIEQWNNQTSYESYFDACQPLFCTYSYVSGATLIYVITTIIGLIGGLTKVFKFIIPLAVRIVRRYVWSFIKQKLSWLDIQNNTVVPIPSASTNGIDNERLATIS
ncbi:unnamed protein product [Didymodactylos carnosus]|uniref:Uncharacterized protein n=1 Tax=Didymodactylos carnosus TaxID=1234261 RepID=A0A815B7G1_9BILA|nr:unnamed protein product [Didymodactylos carnosus]CAF1268392.1 unnamed protein product [Didymodactylos carnosus]CAF3855906.1 unnamed protein product [Didymodactylos carnosus]CAF4053801.1 unnamed protein product [Didymodactylos carnosus]